MSGTPLNLPKWLWLLLALGVLGGQWHQLTCRVSGHGGGVATPVVDHQDAGQPSLDDLESGHQDGEGNGECASHCQFTVAVPCGLTPYAGPVLACSGVVRHGRNDPAPESRLVAVEHPPQLA